MTIIAKKVKALRLFMVALAAIFAIGLATPPASIADEHAKKQEKKQEKKHLKKHEKRHEKKHVKKHLKEHEHGDHGDHSDD